MISQRHVAAAAIALLPLVTSPAQGQGTAALPDSVFQRAQRLVRSGDAARGGALLDSLVGATREGTNQHAQALLWRASLSSDSSRAEGDLIAIIVDHALSPYAADALLRLGQIEYARGARASAVLHLERLVLEHRASAAAPDGWFWLGLTRIASNDVVNGCVALDSAKRRIPTTNVELLNRVTFVAQPCRAIADARAASAAATSPPDTTTAPPKPETRRWSAQVAAFRTSAEAARMVQSLTSKGHRARIDTLRPLFHVRVGAYATRAEAASLVARLKRERIDAIVVEATRREP
jgi:hypothetical protein